MAEEKVAQPAEVADEKVANLMGLADWYDKRGEAPVVDPPLMRKCNVPLENKRMERYMKYMIRISIKNQMLGLISKQKQKLEKDLVVFIYLICYMMLAFTFGSKTGTSVFNDSKSPLIGVKWIRDAENKLLEPGQVSRSLIHLCRHSNTTIMALSS